MSEMLDRVTKAVAEQMLYQGCDCSGGKGYEALAREYARAAIEVMEAMVNEAARAASVGIGKPADNEALK